MAQFANNEPRVHATVFLRKVTVSNGAWLARTLPKMQQRSRPEPGAVRVQDIALRYRSGRVGIADALDAAAAVLTPLAAAGAELIVAMIGTFAMRTRTTRTTMRTKNVLPVYLTNPKKICWSVVVSW